MSEEDKKNHSDDVRDIISATIKELQSNEAQIQFKKPTTIQGWFYISLTFFSIIGLVWSSIIFLNRVATHAESPFHHGTEDLILSMTTQHAEHATSEELHHREEQLELKIHTEVAPIKEKLNTIQTNQASIQANQANFRGDIKNIRDDVQRVQQSIDKLSDQIRKGD